MILPENEKMEQIENGDEDEENEKCNVGLKDAEKYGYASQSDLLKGYKNLRT